MEHERGCKRSKMMRKLRFRMKRYMDDVITVTAKDDSAWDVDRFREDFRRSECYWAPLKLEAAENAHFSTITKRYKPIPKHPDIPLH